MKRNRFFTCPIAVFGLATWSTFGAPAAPSPSNVIVVGADVSTGIAVAKWTDIDGLTYELRGPFATGVKRLEAQVDLQIAALVRKRATMTRISETRDWDFAMKEMNDSRSYLKSSGEEMNTATPETWLQHKEKIGQAWLRTQNAFEKVKASTTN